MADWVGRQSIDDATSTSRPNVTSDNNASERQLHSGLPVIGSSTQRPSQEHQNSSPLISLVPHGNQPAIISRYSNTGTERQSHRSSNTAAEAVESPLPEDKSFAKRSRASGFESIESPLSEDKDFAKRSRASGFESIESGNSESDEGGFQAIKPADNNTNEKSDRPKLTKTASGRVITEEELFRSLSRRRSSVRSLPSRDGLSRQSTAEYGDNHEEQEEIDRLMSRIFGRTRQESSEEEKTRHVGVIWKDLTVKGKGAGASLQPTTGDIFTGLPRTIKNLVTRGPRAAFGAPPVRTIIDDFSGCLRPGEMMLVLGRPGAGCSTFLKVLGNQRFGYESIDGDVTYGGTDAKTMAKKYGGEVLYNPEDDLHYATLSVKNTLKFALRTRTPGKESRKDGESRTDYIKEFMRVVSKLLWLEHAMGTKVGNEIVRGVSGGEKKRVSIAEAMITKASTQCWDNSTRGLDASTALEYVSSLRSMTNMARMCTSVALYQAGESLYERFDKVLLIDQGKCCYFGPADDAAKYFKDLGFVQPDRWTTADFLTSVTDEHERNIKEGWEDRIPRSPDQFAEAFAKSDQRKRNLEEIDEFQKEVEVMIEDRHAAQTKATKKKNYTIPFYQQVIACTKRQFLVMIGDKQSLGGKWGGILFQAVVVGSLFFDLPTTSLGVFPRGGVIFFMLLFNALLALAELTAAFESRPILMKHKSFRFYRPAAYAIAQTVVDVPLVLIQVFLFDIVVYFMSNLQRTASQFFISLLFLWIVTMTMYALFRSLGALLNSLDAATRVTGPVIQALIVYTGYLIPPSKMHPWFSWLRWVNPIQYAFEALLANEYYNLEIECVPPFLVPQGPGATPEYQSCTIQGSTPGSTIVQGANYINTAYGYSRSNLWRDFGIVCAFFIFFVALTALGMELQKPNKGSSSVTIYKRGQVPKDVEKSIEAGQGTRDIESGKAEDADTKGAIASDSKSSSDSDDDDNIAEGIAKNESIFTWQNVTYTIPVKEGHKKLLQDVQGYVKPGRLTALMGASGAGKTTLLNTLAQRINFGVVHGDFMVDGRPLPKSFQRSSGFAEQQDVHESTATVREALRFSAKLRQPKEVPIEEKNAYCEKIIDLLEMRDIAGAAIGSQGEGLNQEQRKRVTIGVELASKPELLIFLDEPTSGLDSGAAFNIVRILRKLADAQVGILCTIHQPSSVLFEYFDTLLLLKSGGRTVYFGELGKDSKTLLDYFKRNGAKRCPPKANPAEYMLDAIGAGNPDYDGPDWGDTWAQSSENEKLTQELQELIKSRRGASADKAVKDDREYAMPITTQIMTVTHRSFTSIWRSPNYVIGLIMLHIFTALFNSFTFWSIGNSQIDMQSRLFSIFMTLTISPPLIQQLQPRFLQARNLFEAREGRAKIYHWSAFVVGIILSEIPYRLVAGTLYWAAWYWPPGFPRTALSAGMMWVWVMMFEMFYLSFGQGIASFAPNELLASLLVPVFFLFVVSFCGVVVPYASLPYFWQSWMYWLSPFKYLLEGMLALVTHNIPVICDDAELAIFPAPPGQTCDSYAGPYSQQAGGYVTTLANGQCGFCQYANGDQFAASFNVFFEYQWRDFGIFWAFIFFNFAVVFVCSWIYLQEGSKLKAMLSPKARKEKKAAKQKEKERDEEGEKA